ncbi:Predicted nucleotide-binding protein containing TIR-like domain-containing protein [Bacillus wiedmannii]|uniref:Predicted nucleotide-binding protein containing TIR-like domain-containing protein n=1 Tax=Bacillus wiedmannii TaxID=1890302 RepID=A0A1G7AY61_9BACI|nr:nucleotide-binding protein [Bacillus wiedmannii]SDE19759.1 Predicted nucleotide-binding protein containing TIR-like domain-containing protein [Bacillus wiedmannii]
MLYHVFMEVTDIPGATKNLSLYEYDKENTNKIIEEIILPYLQKEELQFSGYFLKAQNIVRIQVKTTEFPIKSIVDLIDSQTPANVAWFVTKEDAFIDDVYTQDVTTEIIKEAKLRMQEPLKLSASPSSTEIDNKKVFIVHGHDESVKIAVARFLERLALKPIILHEQASGGTTIIEKIENNTDVGFGIVLYTPCDLGKAKNDDELQIRARQNVIFEHGYLIAKLGRSNVCALVKDNIEKPNDISGVVYVNYDSGTSWHMELFKELKNAGYDLDANKLFL